MTNSIICKNRDRDRGRDLLFEWSHHRISSTDPKVRNTLQNSIKHSSSERVKTGIFFSFQLSYADISFFDFMNSWVAKDKINDYPTELEDFPLLRGLYKHVRDIPAVKQRLETRPDTAL